MASSYHCETSLLQQFPRLWVLCVSSGSASSRTNTSTESRSSFSGINSTIRLWIEEFMVSSTELLSRERSSLFHFPNALILLHIILLKPLVDPTIVAVWNSFSIHHRYLYPFISCFETSLDSSRITSSNKKRPQCSLYVLYRKNPSL